MLLLQVREVARHTPELAQLVVANGGIAALVDYASDSTGNNRLPAVMALGYIAAFSETLALAVIAEKGLPPLAAVLAQVHDRYGQGIAGEVQGIGHLPDEPSRCASGVPGEVALRMC